MIGDHHGLTAGRATPLVRAMEEILGTHRRGHHRLTVCYHAGEHGPEGFYRHLGFHPTGEYNEGETVAERIWPAAMTRPRNKRKIPARRLP